MVRTGHIKKYQIVFDMKRVLFVLNCIEDSLCKKRVEEFIGENYSVKVYGYLRNRQMPALEGGVVLSEIPNTLSYAKRVPILIKTLKKLLGENKGKEITWYFFGLDIALIAFCIRPNIKFIYENADLSYTNIRSRGISYLFKKADQIIVKKSLATVFTSEGFLDFHYNGQRPQNVIIKPNKINRLILSLPTIPKRSLNCKSLSFAFVGLIRYKSIYNMAEVISRCFPNHSFHFYGIFAVDNSEEAKAFKTLESRSNVYFHGRFNNPYDLPKVYSNIDVVVSTYDVTSDNVKYAEPNKIYESIYFRTPIVVSEGTFLANQVKKLGSGYAVNAMLEQCIVDLVNHIETSINDVIDNILKIPQDFAVNESDEFFKALNKHL